MKITVICNALEVHHWTVNAISGVGRGLRPRPPGESVEQSPPYGAGGPPGEQDVRKGKAEPAAGTRRATSEMHTNW